jgi:hypothetical protein
MGNFGGKKKDSDLLSRQDDQVVMASVKEEVGIRVKTS